jgi:CheY-like chemotaxis protein
MAKPRILVADDEEGIRESLGLILGADYELEFARDGEEALVKLKTDGFALALVDIKMPKLDGLEVLRQLKGALRIPVIVLTAYQSVELAKEAIRLGARDYLPKPFERDMLLAAVRRLVP